LSESYGLNSPALTEGYSLRVFEKGILVKIQTQTVAEGCGIPGSNMFCAQQKLSERTNKVNAECQIAWNMWTNTEILTKKREEKRCS
jgi:hypothetical protein